MRLSEQEILVLKKAVSSFDKNAKLYLFGSRVDDNKQGGDIDLLIISEKIDRHDVRKIRLNFYDNFGEQKVDILLDDGSFKHPFNKTLKGKTILL